MKAYKFGIITRPSILGKGEIFEPEIVFTCKALMDGNNDLTVFNEQLLSFWIKSNALGDAHNKWTYETTEAIQIPVQEIANGDELE